MKRFTLMKCMGLAGATMLLCGCGLSQPYPAKQWFGVSAGAPASTSATPRDVVLRVDSVRVAEPFSNREFQYLVGADRFERDYYANFVADPDRLLTAQLTNWLTSSNVFRAVISASSDAGADVSLHCMVTEMYGDFQDANAPKAIFAARFFLIDERGLQGDVLFMRDYRKLESMDSNNAESFAQSLGRAAGRVFGQLTSDIRTVPLKNPASPDNESAATP